MKFFKSGFLIFASIFVVLASYAQTKAAPSAENPPEVEWYPPEIEKSRDPNHAKAIISGRTRPSSLVQIDGDSVSLVKPAAPVATEEKKEVERTLRFRCKVYPSPDIKSKAFGAFKKGATVKALEKTEGWIKVKSPKGVGYISEPCLVPSEINPVPLAPTVTSTSSQPKIESRETRANNEGFFEIAMDLPTGLSQMAVTVTTPAKTEKTFLISVDVNPAKEDIHVASNTKISPNKPPASAKNFRFWAGAGLTYQSYNQITSGSPDLGFSAIQAPGWVARGGYWGERFGIDFYFRDAPGKIQAEAPLQTETTSYHWRTMEAKGLYQFERGPRSRISGLPSQWQLRFGAEVHQIPFMSINASDVVSVEDVNLTMATLGIGLLLGQEHPMSYEFAVGLETPLSAHGPEKEFDVSAPVGFELQIGAAYKFAPGWRLGIFSYTQSVSYSYKSIDDANNVKRGTQQLLYTTCDLRLGYEF